MKFLTKSEGLALLGKWGIDSDDIANLRSFESTPNDSYTTPFELRASQVYPLATKVAEWLDPFDSCVLWVTDFGIWPSSENIHLYTTLRASYGDSRNLGEAPFHVLSNRELDDLRTFLSLGLEFGWGMILVPSPVTCKLIFSHDGWIKCIHDKLIDKIADDISDFFQSPDFGSEAGEVVH